MTVIANGKGKISETTANKKYEEQLNNTVSHHGRSPRELTTTPPQTEIFICTLNTRTLKENSRIDELEHALSKIKWDIVGLAEIRRNHESITEMKNGNILCHTSANKGQYGVGFYIKKKWKNKIIEFKPICERIATLTIEINRQQKIKMIQIHAPTSEASREEIENFYEILEGAMETPQNNIHLIIIGDFNAKIGKRQNEESHIMGNSHYGEKNERGSLLINFAGQYQFKIGNTYFKKPEDSKWTWQSPAGYRNEIDFILLKSMQICTNIEILKNFDFISDHRLVRASLKLSGKPTRIQYQKRTPEGKTILENASIYSERLRKNFANLYNKIHEMGVQELYNSIEETIIKTADTLTENIPKYRNTKFAEDTIKLIKKRTELERIKNKSTSIKIELAETRKVVRKNIRRDAKKYNDNIIEEIMGSSGSTKILHKKLTASKHWIPKLEKNGRSQYGRSEVIKTATEFYRKLYEAEETQNQQTETLSKTKTEHCPDILVEEIQKAIKELKTRKSPAEDNIQNEMLKAGQEELIAPLKILFDKIIQTEEIPVQWKQSQIILLFKKGDKANINNYRPISLTATMCKIFTKIIQRRLKIKLEDYQGEEQAGFMRKKSTIDHIHTINQIIEKANEYNQKIYMAFIDFNKAFDSLDRKQIWEALKDANIDDKYIRIIRNIYDNNTANIKLENKGPTINIQKGVRQGDPLSPDLFNCVLESVMRKMPWKENDFGLNINGRKLTNLRFADDLTLFANTQEELQQLLNDVTINCAKVGLTINYSKTKIMTNCEEIPININQHEIEYTQEYIYLGQLISFKDRMEKEINRRIIAAWKAYWSLKHIFKSKLSMSIKRKTFDTCISPVLTYGCQTWALTERQATIIRSCQNKMERNILGIKISDRIPLAEIKQKTKTADIITTIKSLKWSWAGHVMRKQIGWTRDTTDWFPIENKRNRGRPRKRWSDEIAQIAGSTWPREARDRNKWTQMGEAFVRKGSNLESII